MTSYQNRTGRGRTSPGSPVDADADGCCRRRAGGAADLRRQPAALDRAGHRLAHSRRHDRRRPQPAGGCALDRVGALHRLRHDRVAGCPSGVRPARQVPFGGGSQLLARHLVAGVLLLAAPDASAVHDGPCRAASAFRHSGLRDRGADWGAHPHGRRAGNQEATVSPTTTAQKFYEVQPPEGRRHDCLWDIAERTLGDPLRYKEIFELNRDRVQPDGRSLVDADLIHPGWIFTMPADASGPGITVVEPVRRRPPCPDNRLLRVRTCVPHRVRRTRRIQARPAPGAPAPAWEKGIRTGRPRAASVGAC